MTKSAEKVIQEPKAPGILKPEPSNNSSKKPLLFAGLGIGLVVAGIFGFNWWQYATTHEDTDNATVSSHLHPVSARINATVQAVLFQDNQTVKAGQILIQLDPRDYQLQVQQFQAALAVAKRQAATALTTVTYAQSKAGAQNTQALGGLGSAQAGIATAQAALKEAQAGVPAARATLDQAKANLVKAQLDYQRYQQLSSQGAISQQQLDAARATYQVAVATRAQSEQSVAQAQSRVAQAAQSIAEARSKFQQSEGSLQDAQAAKGQTDVNRAQYEAAQAQVAQAQANLANVRLQLSYTKIMAPSNGRIGRRSVEVGQRVQPGQALLSVVEDQIWVTANFKETQLENMRPKQEVEIKLDSFPGHPFKGMVDSIAPASGAQFALLPPDNATGNFTKIVQRIPVKVVFDKQSLKGYENLVAPGMSAVVSVKVK
jgi:membrane fusion protein, multidrug efflux system